MITAINSSVCPKFRYIGDVTPSDDFSSCIERRLWPWWIASDGGYLSNLLKTTTITIAASMTNNVRPVNFSRWNFSANNLYNIPEQEFVIQELRQDADTFKRIALPSLRILVGLSCIMYFLSFIFFSLFCLPHSFSFIQSALVHQSSEHHPTQSFPPFAYHI